MADIPRNIYPSQRQATGGYEEAKAPIQGQQDHVPEMGVFVTGGQDRRDMQDDHSPELGAFAAYEEYDDNDDYDEDGHPISILVSKVKPEQVRWLWPGRIPLGKLTILDGDPGLGKSLLTLDLAARVTKGGPMPDGSTSDLGGPRGVVLLACEDDPADTLRPRLDAAGADCSRIVLLSAVREAVPRGDAIETRERMPSLADLGAIREAIRQVDAALVIVDPVTAYTVGDTHVDADMRALLAKLAEVAGELGVAIVVVRHLNKSGGGNPL